MDNPDFPLQSQGSTRSSGPEYRWRRVWLIASCVAFLAAPLHAQSGALSQPGSGGGPWNLPLPTLGGPQFWTDVQIADGWHLQRNLETGHYRLLDSRQVRRAWGSLENCQREFKQRMAAGQIQAPRGEVVILLHGLIRATDSMGPMADSFARQGFCALNFGYASTRGTVGDHARDLDRVIRELGEEVTSIDLVGHSLGNLVVRRYLHDQTDPTSGRQGDSRIRRIVMLGPPNQGSRTARLLRSSLAFHTVAGISGGQLALGWDKLEPTLAIPQVPFGIIAGGQAEGSWSNVLLPGPDDLTVSVAETRLPGAADFWVAPLWHTTMMRQPEVLDACARFLRHGYFRADQVPQPIPRR